MKLRNRILTSALSLILTLSILIQPTLAAFQDVSPGSWYESSVEYVYSHSLFSGTSYSTFSPNENMTRGMFVTVLYRMSQPDTQSTSTRFSDVPSSAYYAAPVRWASDNGIVYGTSDTLFSPNASVTREQICAMLIRYCSYMEVQLGGAGPVPDFDDIETVSSYARDGVAICLNSGLISGFGDDTLRPQSTATRAQVSSIICRLGTLMEAQGFTVGTERKDDWKMILVNSSHPIPEGYAETISLKYVENGKYIDARAYDDLTAMLAAMRADGCYPLLNQAYRSHAEQQAIYNNRINLYLSYGWSYAQALAQTQKEVAYPGTSEHELGLAVDITSNYNATAVYNWLAKYACKYGFIYRYPAGKTAITGITNEPWHYRYVGRENAEKIQASGLCLEEYLGAA